MKSHYNEQYLRVIFKKQRGDVWAEPVCLSIQLNIGYFWLKGVCCVASYMHTLLSVQQHTV